MLEKFSFKIKRKFACLVIDLIKYVTFRIKSISVIKLRNFCYKFVLKEMGKGCNICDAVTFKDPEKISLGERVSIHEYCFLGGCGEIKIGNNVAIAHGCSTISEKHNFSDTDILIKNQGVTAQPIVIGDNVWFGCKVTILGNMRIGNGTIVGAGSIVTKSLPDNVIAAGNPCKIIKVRS